LIELASLGSVSSVRFFTMDSGNRSTVRLCARRTGLNFKGRQSGGILGRPSVWKWPVARAAVFSAFARCRSILSCRRHSPEQKQDPPAPPVFPESGSCTQVCKLPLVDLVMVTWILVEHSSTIGCKKVIPTRSQL